jgi:DnaK suppressor protein
MEQLYCVSRTQRLTRSYGFSVTDQPDAALAAIAEILAAKRADLEVELDGLAAPGEDSGGISFGKRVGDGTSIAVERLSQVAAHDRLRALLADVRRAQLKVADGSYGLCDRCGTPIPADRLEVLPWATHCVTCPSVL